MKLGRSKEPDSPKPNRALKVSTEQTQEPSPLQKYQDVYLKSLKFAAEHSEVFDYYDHIQEELAVALDEVKTYCKQKQVSLETALFRAEFGEAKSRWYAPEIVRKLVPAALVESMGLIITKEEVDEKALKALVKLGKADESVLKQAYREKVANVRVNIERKT